MSGLSCVKEYMYIYVYFCLRHKITSRKTLEQFMKSVLFQFSQSKMAAHSVLEAVDILTVALSTTYTVLQTEYCTVIARRY